jgi:uncharacterized membrane protein
MSKINKSVIAIAIVLLIVALIPVVFFIAKFYNQDISSSGTDWSDFGSYFGGILNPIIAISNVLVLIYLTLKVSEFENNRNEKSLIFQKDLAVQQIKYQSFKDVNALFLRISHVSIDDGKLIDDKKYLKLKIEFNSIISPCVNLFNSLEPIRINRIGSLIFDYGVWLEHEQDENKEEFSAKLIERSNELIEEYTSLLNDMRQEL